MAELTVIGGSDNDLVCHLQLAVITRIWMVQWKESLLGRDRIARHQWANRPSNEQPFGLSRAPIRCCGVRPLQLKTPICVDKSSMPAFCDTQIFLKEHR